MKKMNFKEWKKNIEDEVFYIDLQEIQGIQGIDVTVGHNNVNITSQCGAEGIFSLEQGGITYKFEVYVQYIYQEHVNTGVEVRKTVYFDAQGGFNVSSVKEMLCKHLGIQESQIIEPPEKIVSLPLPKWQGKVVSDDPWATTSGEDVMFATEAISAAKEYIAILEKKIAEIS